jgi:predicted nucleotidyltransferase
MRTLPEFDIDIHPITQKALDLFIEKIKDHEGENLSKIILYGSVARGEANEDSDIDVLVILKECLFKNKKAIWSISSDVILDMNFDENAYLQALPMSIVSSLGLDFYTLMHNVNREGVILYDAYR